MILFIMVIIVRLLPQLHNAARGPAVMHSTSNGITIAAMR